MYRFLRKHRTFLFLSLAFVFVGLIFFGAGGQSLVHSPLDTIMKVNGHKITQNQFDIIYRQIQRQQPEDQNKDQNMILSQAMNEVIREEVFRQEAARYGIFVPDQELQFMLHGTPAFQKEGRFDPETYWRTITSALGMTTKEFEKARKNDLASQKVNMLIASAIRVPGATLQDSVRQRIQMETDPKKRKELENQVDSIKEEIRSQELNHVFSDWLGQINSQLKVDIVSEPFKQRLSGQPS